MAFSFRNEPVSQSSTTMSLIAMLLTFVSSHWWQSLTALSGLSTIELVVTRVMSASVKYLVAANFQGSVPVKTIVIKNFETASIRKIGAEAELCLNIMPAFAGHRIIAVTCEAGPWLELVERRGNGASIYLQEFPAEAAFAIVCELSDAAADLQLAWS